MRERRACEKGEHARKESMRERRACEKGEHARKESMRERRAREKEGYALKIVSVVGPKKSGKTALVEALARSLKRHGRVGTVKNMPDHPIEDRGDTRRHFDAGADVVVGVGKDGVLFKVARGGGLEQALDELKKSGVEYAIVEGFKRSDLPKIVLGGLEVSNPIKEVNASPPYSDDLIEELVGLLISLPDL